MTGLTRPMNNQAVKQFVDSKVADHQQIPSTDTTPAPIRVVIPFKDQVSANIVKKRLTDLRLKIKTTIQPVFISRKLNEDLKFREVKPAIVNQQCLVYQFQCNLCDAGYVGYTRGHLHERVDGHKQKSSSICKHKRPLASGKPQAANRKPQTANGRYALAVSCLRDFKL